MSWKKSLLSLHQGTGHEVMTESSRAFNALVGTDPAQMQRRYGFRYGELVRDTLETTGAEPVSQGTLDLVRAGMLDTLNVFEQAFVHAQLNDASLVEREAIAVHPMTARSFAVLALRDQESKDVAIGAYPGGQPALVLSTDRTHITTGLAPRSGERVCPFAGEKPASVFDKFVRWAGVYAVHADDPSYRRRNNLT